ncbi:MAG TPA: uracil-DNA glycosylase family protein [Pyrinomonadaceae bacterium]|nr:uracil-DNA glycosylase family protein [Pyrinomonadaceae bacterium]
MSNEKQRKELTAFFTEIKEQVLYLQELGVENINVDLPEILIPNSNSEIPRERLEKFVPSEEILKKVAEAPPKVESEETKTARRSLLEQTRLSRLPSLPKRSSFIPTNQNQEQGEKEEMPRKKIEEIPQDTLFGDISQTLPEANETLEDIHADCGNCTRCPLWEGRTKIVHSTGNREADLLFIGEAPGANEDAEGKPFVGRAGQLLNKIIGAIGLEREDVFIGNVNRCRPPGNRQPTQAEADVCKQFLIREIAVVRPKIIVVLGNTATQNLLNTKVGITKLRGEFQDYYGVKVMPTFHPAYLLRDPSKKRETWEDMKKVRDELNKLK